MEHPKSLHNPMLVNSPPDPPPDPSHNTPMLDPINSPMQPPMMAHLSGDQIESSLMAGNKGSQDHMNPSVKEAPTSDQRDHALPNWIPQVGMTFNNVEEARSFWNYYGGRMGFSTRKKYGNTSKADGIVTSCRFVCNKQGVRGKDKRDHLTKNPRAETRTDCKARMGVSLKRTIEKYEVVDLVVEHNHVLQTPETAHLMPSQRGISAVQAFEIEMADDSGVRPRTAHELASRHVGGSTNLGYTAQDHKNYLRTKRQKEMKYGEAGGLLHYFQNKAAENPSFFYGLQLDNEEQIANIFWADARMIIDYSHFGDVITFDTTFGTNMEKRPFGVFVGFNHFRETVIFGAALMYDETFESFVWLFDTFLTAHSKKQPRTIYTDQDIAMGIAIAHVFPYTWHGLCTWHIMQNAIKHLNRHRTDGSNILADFSACMYEYNDEDQFEEVFFSMRSKVDKQSWLDSIYKVKEKWAQCYMRNVYTLGMRSTQLSEKLNAHLKNYLTTELNVLRFLKHFERAVQVKREVEIKSEYESRNKLSQIKMRTPMLLQASRLYTPPIFEVFQIVYERSMFAYAQPTDDRNAYIVSIKSLDDPLIDKEKHMVDGSFHEGKLYCSCQQFERCGLLCCHAIKILELMDIKQLPNHYILKRWTREARHGIVQDNIGRNISDDPKLEATRQFKYRVQKFISLASRAAKFEEASLLVDKALDSLHKEVEEKLSQCSIDKTTQPPNVPPTTQEGMALPAGLKKKETRKGGWKRQKN